MTKILENNLKQVSDNKEKIHKNLSKIKNKENALKKYEQTKLKLDSYINNELNFDKKASLEEKLNKVMQKMSRVNEVIDECENRNTLLEEKVNQKLSIAKNRTTLEMDKISKKLNKVKEEHKKIHELIQTKQRLRLRTKNTEKYNRLTEVIDDKLKKEIEKKREANVLNRKLAKLKKVDLALNNTDTQELSEQIKVLKSITPKVKKKKREHKNVKNEKICKEKLHKEGKNELIVVDKPLKDGVFIIDVVENMSYMFDGTQINIINKNLNIENKNIKKESYEKVYKDRSVFFKLFNRAKYNKVVNSYLLEACKGDTEQEKLYVDSMMSKNYSEVPFKSLIRVSNQGVNSKEIIKLINYLDKYFSFKGIAKITNKNEITVEILDEDSGIVKEIGINGDGEIISNIINAGKSNIYNTYKLNDVISYRSEESRKEQGQHDRLGYSTDGTNTRRNLPEVRNAMNEWVLEK